jgi:outer membrane protein
VQSYYEVLLAQRQVSVAQDAVKTATAIEEQSRNRVESGVAVDADLLSSQVLTASRQQELIRARNDLSYATTQLAITVGVPVDALLSPADVLTPGDLGSVDVGALERDALQQRPDLRRLMSEQGAQQQSVAIAKRAFGPRVNTFGSWQTDSHSLGWNGGNNWTAGIELQLDLFSGGAKSAQLQREKAMAERIAAMRSSFEDNVRLEVRRAYYDYDAARQQVGVAKAATEQAAESLRILRNRYDAGLTTVTELLRAEDASNRAQTDYWNAVYRLQTSYANLELASGKLTIDSPVVTR